MTKRWKDNGRRKRRWRRSWATRRLLDLNISTIICTLLRLCCISCIDVQLFGPLFARALISKVKAYTGRFKAVLQRQGMIQCAISGPVFKHTQRHFPILPGLLSTTVPSWNTSCRQVRKSNCANEIWRSGCMPVSRSQRHG